MSEEKASTKRRRTRLLPADRREQLLAAARKIAIEDGVHALTIRRLADAVGIGEAQAHNYFKREELLVELARRELSDMEESRQADISRGGDLMTRLVLGTVGYLREVEARGVLIQTLLGTPEVRRALKPERAAGPAAVGERIYKEYGVPPEIGAATTRILAALSRRAGRLLAEGRLTPKEAERLALGMVVGGNRRMIDRWGAKKA